ncbi:hypothetical protein G8759_31245 [Spirosoma aureum]|uniref:Uncharacterized protein n=1 Tax=Spirosoma aureum TaxID=2692134 RepID=A0A6G9AWL1_9BACT|nr:hypothetical protein [Spirosoma aureum]QIP16800.1 hypothetical protein G8759_31245 [Spirosoma aureum]
MEITHEVLIHQGFMPDTGRPGRYNYRGFHGYLRASAGLFFFHGFSFGIGTVTDLKYLLMLIDYQHASPTFSFPPSTN